MDNDSPAAEIMFVIIFGWLFDGVTPGRQVDAEYFLIVSKHDFILCDWALRDDGGNIWRTASCVNQIFCATNRVRNGDPRSVLLQTFSPKGESSSPIRQRRRPMQWRRRGPGENYRCVSGPCSGG